MSEHRAMIHWQRGDAPFTFKDYSRDHAWSFISGVEVPGSSAPGYFGNADRVDPEEAFVASLSSCHMLTFLALCAKKRLVVESYRDQAVGHLEKNDDDKLAITRVVLRPTIEFGGEKRPGPDELARLHDRAHAHCFIANSVKTRVTVEEPEPS